MKEIPEPFTEYPEDIMSNFDDSVNVDVETAIKGKEYYAGYPGWNFHGRVWWQKTWHCEVWVYGSPQEIITAETLDDLREKVCDKYGYE